ncbi:MAG: DUF883 family protein [Gammaproteobacteria bacterium]
MDTGTRSTFEVDKNTDAAHTAERLRTVAHERIDRVSEAVQPVVDRLSATAHEKVDQVTGAASHAAAEITAKTEHVRELQSRLADECRQYVHAHPLKSLGYAAAVGFVVTRLLRL